ncbi:hypothetical protein ACFSQ7_08115 [Paenibacillus rhizoplanae]
MKTSYGGLATASFSGLLWSPEVRQTATREELLRRIGAVIFLASGGA